MLKAEAYNEDELLGVWTDKVLHILGYETLQETTLPDGSEYVDHLLFASANERRDAIRLREKDQTTAMYQRAPGVLEAKQWDTDFEERFSEDRHYRDASHQVKYYLERTPSQIQWGILTDGRKWRLRHQRL